MLGSPQSTSVEIQATGERDVYGWSCGCIATHESHRTYCVIKWCEFHRETLLPKS